MKEGILDVLDRWSKSTDEVSKLVNFRGKNYILNSRKKLIYGDEREGDIYNHGYLFLNLYDDKKFVGSAEILLNTYRQYNIENMKICGYYHIPKCAFQLMYIDLKEEYQDIGLGSFLLNCGIKEIEKFNKEHNYDLPLLINRLTNEKNIRFYYKWKAEYNKPGLDDELGKTVQMIIVNPKIQEKYNGEKICVKKLIKSQLDGQKDINQDFSCERDDK